jgi:photosystem II stability/assembly factor-like uncharacterized protein
VYISNAQEQWILRNSRDKIPQFTDIIKTDQYFVVIGTLGTIMVSTDGMNWNVLKSHTLSKLNRITTSGSVGVIVGENGTILSTDNFLNWNICDNGNLTKRSIQNIIWTGRIFLAVGDSGTVLSSSNGSKWYLESTNIRNDLGDIAFGNNMYVAIGEQRTVLISNDDVNWIIQDNAPDSTLIIRNDSTFSLTSVKWFDGRFYLTGGKKRDYIPDAGYIGCSTNGIKWITELDTLEYYYMLADGNVKQIVFKGDQAFILKGHINNYGGDQIFSKKYSSICYGNSLRWAKIGNQLKCNVSKMISEDSVYIALCEDSIFYSKDNGITWLNVSNKYAINTMNEVIWTGYNFIAVGDSNEISTSTNGIEWKKVSGFGNYYKRSLRGIAKTDSGLIITGYRCTPGSMDTYNTISCSTDSGKTWIPKYQFGGSGCSYNLKRVTYNGGKNIIACASFNDNDASGVYLPKTTIDKGYVCEFKKVLDFKTSFSAINLLDVAYKDTMTLVVGSEGQIFSSVDLNNWYLKNSGVTTNLRGICYDSIVNQWIVVGDSGTVLTSSDGENWIKRNSGITSNLNDVTFNDSVVIAVGNNGTIIVSDNLIDWKAKSSGTSKALNSIAWNGKRFVAVGQDAIVLTSSDEIVSIDKSRKNARLNFESKFSKYNNKIIITSGNTGKYFVYDMRGRLVKRGTIPSENKNSEIDIKGFSDGMYILHVNSQNEKIIKNFNLLKRGINLFW